jgi:hypothetical protein
MKEILKDDELEHLGELINFYLYGCLKIQENEAKENIRDYLLYIKEKFEITK